MKQSRKKHSPAFKPKSTEGQRKGALEGATGEMA